MSKRVTSTTAAAKMTARNVSSTSTSMPPPRTIPGRPASSMSSSGTSSNLKDEAGSRASSPKRGVKRSIAGVNGSKSGENGNGEINIQVVVRCRGRSPQELASASPIITTTSGPLCKSVTVETTPIASSSLSGFTTASSYGGGGPTTKTYPFDKVFGPEADQTMVFNEVAEEMLHEVLAGYNCTIFAYGQTGTGKTYTMQGDLELTNLSAPKSEAGIVPRVLHRLFALLNSSGSSEYSVKCSYVELYNEELRDLLSNEYTPSTTAEKQPMAPGGAVGLKLYEDGKKGVMIQGLEEAPVRNLKESLAILHKGCQRRQVAETKMNTESSRSHTIFSITVHVKETSVTGEDFMRIGKFNLVDLAGSEAIGRSGATDKRAREAGMINQSLLTLGRVISALVEKGSHIPYRESKLTRLLQDSLGGRTKTCIVATVSPTRSNMEETLSTLDYAIRAKSIRNRPEINHHVTRTGLLKEYMGDIDRLKNELLAAREKNGIYIPEDQWREMHEEQARMKSDFDEARMKAAAIAVELNTRKKEFDEISVKFLATVDELAQAREAERELEQLILKTKSELEETRVKLEEEAIISRAFETGEGRIGTVAEDLKQVANESVADVGGLFEKLARKARILGANTDAATKFGNTINTVSTDLRKGLKQMHHVQGEFGKKLRGEMQALVRYSQEASANQISAIDVALGSFTSTAGELARSVREGNAVVSASANEVESVKRALQTSVRDWTAALSQISASMVEDVLHHQQEHLATVESVVESTTELVTAVIASTREHMIAEAEANERSRQKAQTTAQAEITRLQAQNAMLGQMLADEKAKTAKLRDELVRNLTSMIVSFTDSQDKSWTEAVGQVQMANGVGVDDMGSFSRQIDVEREEARQREALITKSLSATASAASVQRASGDKALRNVSNEVRSRLELFSRKTNDESRSRREEVDEMCERISGAATGAARQMSDASDIQLQQVHSLSSSVTSALTSVKERSSSLNGEIVNRSDGIASMHTASASTFDAIYSESSKNVKSILASTSNFISSGILDDVPTGVTPKKRVWNVQQSWERTEPREVLLEMHRRRKEETESEEASSPSSTTSSAELPPAVLIEVDPNPLASSQIRTKAKAKEGFGFGGKSDNKIVVGVDKIVPLGEGGANIPRRTRK